ncbi:MAG: rod shape-determining protein MreC [Cuspidothrix sp.]
MFTARRWWEYKGLQVGLLALVIGSAWTLRETKGALLREIYQTITSPLQNLHSGTMPEQNLRDAKMLELETRITELESQNEKLKSLVGYVEKESQSQKTIIARVVGRSANHWWQQVILNRGSASGIKAGSIVKADGGLVGLVENVTSNTSIVILVSDLKSQIGVTVSRTSAKGILQGDASGEGILEFYEKIPNVKVGDLVSTSTYSQKFPPGLPIGRIKYLDLKKLPASIAKVELFPPIRYLDWVTVYPQVEKQESESPEKLKIKN